MREDLQKLQNLRRELKELRQRRKVRTKQLKTQYKQDVADCNHSFDMSKRGIKADIVTVKQGGKALVPVQDAALTTTEPQPKPEGYKMFDNTQLALCAPFERRAAAIRYRQRDPKGFEADQIVENCTKVVEAFKARVDKGKELRDKDLKVLLKIRETMAHITREKLGVLYVEAAELGGQISQLLPPAISQGADQIDSMMGRVMEMMQNMVASPSPTPA